MVTFDQLHDTIKVYIKRIGNIYSKYIYIFGKYYSQYLSLFILASILLILSAVAVFPVPLIFRAIIDNALPSNNIKLLLTLISLSIITHLFQKCASYISSRVYFTLNSRIMLDLKTRILRRIAFSKFEEFRKYSSEYIFSRINEDPGYINTLFGQHLISILKDILVSIVCIVGLVLISLKLSIIVGLIIPPLIVINIYYSRKMKSKFSNYLECRAQESAILQSVLKALNYLKLSNRETVALTNYFGNAAKSHREDVKYGKYHYANLLTIGIMTSFTPLFVLGYGGYQVIQGDISLGTLLGFNAYLGYLFNSIFSIMNTNITLQVAMAAFDRVFEILSYKEEIPLRHNMLNINTIAYKSVSFSYNTNNSVLNDISMDFQKGKSYGIVGESGVGKSTLFKLLLGSYPVSKGHIVINNTVCSVTDLQKTRYRIALVEQEPILLPISILDNLRILNPNASTKKVIDSVKRVELHDFIKSQEYGYHTIVEKHSFPLSVGQKQRLAIARALLREPDVFLFDEITANLDTKNEKTIIDLIKRTMANSITMIVAHRLSTVQHCDRIYVMQDGMIVESGTHQQLVEKRGFYYDFYSP